MSDESCTLAWMPNMKFEFWTDFNVSHQRNGKGLISYPKFVTCNRGDLVDCKVFKIVTW